jgi:uncharacterized protein YbbC (DUF1343 family)/CubicO group peptidase (beta-lactamase class C family)
LIRKDDNKIKSALVCILSGLLFFTYSAAQDAAASSTKKLKENLKQIPGIVNEAISKRQIPGAVILIGDHEKVLYRSAFGDRALKPEKLPMTADTIFDIASLTKVIATATAVMQLAENGRLDINAPVVKYWPEFGANGKQEITIRQLLTHYSGLRADLPLKPGWSGYEASLLKIIAERPGYSPGTHFEYSDINFQILGELVQRLSGQPLAAYCDEHIFRPLGMKDTFFNPSRKLRSRIAPTEYPPGNKKKLLWGKVHDPIAMRSGGVAGHAGLFSTAADLAVFAKMLLNGGGLNGINILNPDTIERMMMPQSPPDNIPLRGLGWNIGAPVVSNREELFPAGSCFHTGYTGTAMWIDPVTDTYIIVLTNRLHPNGKGDAGPLRKRIVGLVADAYGPLSVDRLIEKSPLLSNYYKTPDKIRYANNTRIKTGIDVLRDENFAPLSGMRIGLITNHSGIDSSGRRTIDLFYNAKGLILSALFSPEHGLYGEADNKVASAEDTVSGLPVYSLYGEVLRPDEKMLDGLDALVFDIQDAGARFYTYVTTMGYAMEAAAKKGIPFYVLDRPNPVTCSIVQGPVMDRDMKSFTGYFPLPVRHGMTLGEMAEMFNAEYKINAALHVIKMQGYMRTHWFDETGLTWVNPSPNLRSITEAVLYPGAAMAEGANVSVGRGTATPFELLGAPWINAERLSAYMKGRRIPGVDFDPVNFTPAGDRYRDQLCHGVKIVLTDRDALDSAALGIEIISALYKLYPEDFQIDNTLGLIGSRKVLKEIKDGDDPQSIIQNWQGPLAGFLSMRKRYLLY